MISADGSVGRLLRGRPIIRGVFESPRWVFLLVLGAVAGAKSGVWTIPNVEVLARIAASPLDNPFASGDVGGYNVWTWLSPVVAHTIGATSPLPYFTLHLLAALGFVTLAAWLAFSRLDDDQARIALIIFVALPASWISFYWVGPDGLTLVLLLVALAFARYRGVTVLCGLGLGLQHFEQAIFAVSALLLADLIGRRVGARPSAVDWRFAAILIGSACLGHLIQFAVFSSFGANQPATRLDYFRANAQTIIDGVGQNWPLVLWSGLGLGWLVAAYYVTLGRRTLAFFVPLGVLLVLLLSVVDQTRVMALVTFPLVVRFWLSDREFLDRFGRGRATLLLLVWIVFPTIFVWRATAFGSALPFDIALALHGLFEGYPIPRQLASWPFG